MVKGAQVRRGALPVRWLVVLVALVGGGVGGGGCRRVRFEDQVLTKPGVRYQLGAVPPGWRQLRLAGNDVAYSYDATGHAMSANATCEEHGDAPLEVLTRHLLQGFTGREELGQERLWLDGREALRTHVRARLEGVPVELLLVVLKKDNCVYDLSYVAPLGRFEEHLHAFDSLVQGFQAAPTP